MIDYKAIQQPTTGGAGPNPYAHDWDWQKQVNPGLMTGQGPTGPGIAPITGGYDPVQNQGGYSPDPYSSQTGGAVNFNYPGQWGEASKFYSQQLGGGVGAPGEWDVGSNYLQDLIRGGGNATSGTDWWKAQQAMGNQRLQDQANQLAEQHGMLGTNFSSMLGHDITDATRRQNEDMLAQMSMLDYQGQEAAKQRLMEATSGLYNFGQGRAGLGLSNLANQFGAAGGLMNAGTAYSQLPLQVAGQMNQIGQGIYGQQAGQLQQQTPSWLQGALGYLGQTAGGVPTTYQPSIWEKLAGVASQIPGVGGSSTSLGYTPAPQTNPAFVNRVLAGQPGEWDQGGGYTYPS